MDRRSPSRPGVYRERLWPTWWVLLLGATTLLMLAVAYGAAVSPAAGWSVAVVGTTLAIALVIRTSPVVEVSSDGLRYANIVIPVSAIGASRQLTRDQARDVMNLREPTQRPYLAVRGWAAKESVLVDITDPEDPHTHILVSSRTPHALSEALRALNADAKP